MLTVDSIDFCKNGPEIFLVCKSQYPHLLLTPEIREYWSYEYHRLEGNYGYRQEENFYQRHDIAIDSLI